MSTWLKKIFGSQNERLIKSIQPLVDAVNKTEATYAALSDEAIGQLTAQFRSRLTQRETIDDLLPEAFAAVREAAKRTLGLRHYDVQLIGGIVLHQGKIAEMKTGEGKTLVATLPVYLNALAGKGVHVVTVNDYLARRDAAWMGRIYTFLGMTVGCIVHGLSDAERKAAYAADITYGTNNEFGFDFLRDNMKFQVEAMAQRELDFAIVDEVDSILIDEARTPLIISGPAEASTDRYTTINKIIPGLKAETHYTVDEKHRSSLLTEDGVAEVEKRLQIENLFDPKNIEFLHHVNQALRAHTLYKRDVDYVVKDGRVMIVDEFTGRLMEGRRWSDGLHQAVEAKEGVAIENENQTLASITFQNYFRMYKKLAGMTGTADTEAAEFASIYGLDVVVIPPNRPMQRDDKNDLIFKNEKAKFKALVDEIARLQKEGRPVLVGTIAIEKSEALSQALKAQGVPHHVLNAKQHEREAEIVAQAGRLGMVTVSTNMAGRGTDIMLGGNPEFLARAAVGSDADAATYQARLSEFKEQCQKEREAVLTLGGLFILGTERHESRRIDNQLRGRSGRQGDPGCTQFYISLDDNLMRIFGSDRLSTMMDRVGMSEDEIIEHRFITKAIENAQKKVEAHNFDIRKNILEYDDVLNQQRQTIYSRRKQILRGESLGDLITDALDTAADQLTRQWPGKKASGDEINAFGDLFTQQFGFRTDLTPFAGQDAEIVGQRVFDEADAFYQRKTTEVGLDLMAMVERYIILQTLDALWKEHLLAMDHLREGIGLKAYGQKDPKLEYKREGFEMFQAMMRRFQLDCIEKLFKVQVQKNEDVPQAKAERVRTVESRSEGISTSGAGAGLSSFEASNTDVPPRPSMPRKPQATVTGTVRRAVAKVGRNDPCPCGSGQKYKKCHGVGE
jgi:preprotein translocase subunit SecA